MNVLKGYLTYSLAGLAVAFSLLNLASGVLGFEAFIDNQQALSILWSGLAIFGIRRAVG